METASCGMETASADVSLVWRWILEHLVDSKNIGTPIIKEIMTYIPNLAYHSSLNRRTALRYLEEAISASRIDAQVIPLIQALLEESHSSSNFPTNSDYSSLLLRVKVEAVIVYVRGQKKDWQGFSRAIDQIFPENGVDINLYQKRSELLSFLQDEVQERSLKEIFDKYCLRALQQDLSKCISAEKLRLREPFLEKLLQDVFNGTYPVLAASHKPTVEKEVSQQLSADSDSDDTIIGGRNSNAGLEEMIESEVSKKLRLDCSKSRQDQHGKAVASNSPWNPLPKETLQVPISRHTENEQTLSETVGDSLHVDFLTLGSDGHEEFCHKCQEGGRLLCCDGCPIAVHRKCLGYDVQNLTEKDWFCPLCERKRTAEALARAKEEELAARKRVLNFLQSVHERENEKQETGKQRSDSRNRRSLPEDSVRKISLRRGSIASKDTSNEVLASRKQTSMDPCNSRVNVWFEACSPANQSCEHISDVPSEQDGETTKIRGESKEPAAAFDENISLPSEDIRGNNKDHAPVDLRSNINNISLPSEDIRSNNEDHAPVDLRSKTSAMNQSDSSIEKMNIEGQIGEGDGHDGDLEEDNESREPEIVRPKRDRRLYFRGNRIIPGLRRKRLKWTKVEEDTLREGVKRFSHDNGSWGFQWTRIIEFGQGKFHPSRTDVDLKDKWRHLRNH